jgi:hypothetical protein
VGLITNFGVSSPVVKNGRVTGFYDGWVANRKYPVDMAGFAVSVDVVLKVSQKTRQLDKTRNTYRVSAFGCS